MPLTIEILPDPAANDLRLRQLVAERSSPLDRLNLMCGSGLQRLAAQRMLAEANDGGLAAVYGYTPVDLAASAARFGHAPQRRSWPTGADLTALCEILPSLPLKRLDPGAPGISAALLRTLTDLREGALSNDDLPDGDLKTVFGAWLEVVAGYADRTSRYEDAVSTSTPAEAFREALGSAPLIVSGIYDLTRIQRLLLGRLAESSEVRMLLVAPSNDPASPAVATLEALRRELNPRIIRSTIAAQPRADVQLFSAADPTAEADEIASRILELGRRNVPFHRIAVLHQQGSPTDDRIVAALERAEIPAWRIGGRQLARTPTGHAVRLLVDMLLQPDGVERGALLDWLSHRSLRERIVGVERRLGAWEQVSLDAGLARGLHGMNEQLGAFLDASQSDDAAGLAQILGDLRDRSRELAAAESWAEAANTLLEAFDDYVEAVDEDESEALALRVASREIIEQLDAYDLLGTAWSPQAGRTAIERTFGSRVVRDPRRLIGGVNVGAVTGPARGIPYRAVFAAGVAERVIPAVGRDDPLLPDDQRAAINARVPGALALQRDRADSDRHAWTLMRHAATETFSASWSRRSSATGGPARASSLILEAAAEPAPEDGSLTEASLSESGRIERISSSSAGISENSTEERWTRAIESTDAGSFGLELLSASQVDVQTVLHDLWPMAEFAERARLGRNAPRFTEYDGLLQDTELPGEWSPLERSWSASEIETLVVCPYRFYLLHVIGVRRMSAGDRPDRPRRDARAGLIRQVLASWVREYERNRAHQTWFEYAETPQFMGTIARRILDHAAEQGILGPPAAVSSARSEMLRELERSRLRDVSDAREGWRPLAVNLSFSDAPVRVAGGRELRWRGLIHRLDEHAGGRQRAHSYFSGRELPDVRGFVNGSSFQSIAALSALTQRGVPIAQAEVEHRSVTHRGNFESQTLRGESLTGGGGRGAPSDGERLRDVLAVIADQLEQANFVPYPGQPLRDRPNCRRCPVESSCTADVWQRYERKAQRDQDAVRRLEIVRRQRV